MPQHSEKSAVNSSIDAALLLQVFQDMTRAVNSSLILEDIFEALGDVLQQYLSYDQASILILDETQNGIHVSVRLFADGTTDILRGNNAFAGYDTLVKQMIEQRRPIGQAGLSPAETLRQTELFDPERLLPDKSVSLLAVPLINKGVLIGVMGLLKQAEDKDLKAFSLSEQALLEQLTEQLALAVENAKFYWQTQTQASREFLINHLTKAIRQSLEIETILTTAVNEIGRVMGVSRCAIHYVPLNKMDRPACEQTLRLNAWKTFEYTMPGVPTVSNPLPLSADDSPQACLPFEHRVFELRQKNQQQQSQATSPLNSRQNSRQNPFVLNDVRDCPPSLVHPDYFAENQIQSLVVVPIFLREALVGTLTLHQCDRVRAWVQDDIDLLEAMAEHLGVALAQAQLFEELAEQKQTLEQALEELQQAQIHLVQSEKMAVLGQFVAGIAHEVNTPLGTIASNNGTLLNCLKRLQLSGDEQQRSLQTSMQDLLELNRLGTDRIQEIVRNLRNFARLDESERKQADLHEGIDATLLLMRASIPPDIEVIKHYDSNLPLVSCFPGLLNQVFMNLLVNAVHALQDLPAALKKTVTITTSWQPQTAEIQVSIADTGKGILPEHLPKIFDPGFTTKGVGVGTGLGLALCYKIVDKHRGRIQVNSQVGHGTVFCITIPV